LLRRTPGAEARPGHAIGRILALAFGAVAYAVFLGAFLYAIGFVTGLIVPKTIDTGPMGPVGEALVIDVLLLTVFALQHSVMARAPSSAGGRSTCRPRSSAACMCFWQAWR
jgi:protein-S-isoprenylcysteine O-methyltransferase Ste14